jgi:hypothetical protein
MHPLRIVGAHEAGLGQQIRTLQVIADNRRRQGRVLFDTSLNPGELGAEPINAVRDEGEQNPARPMRMEGRDRLFQFSGRQVVLLEIDPGESIDLQVEKAG